MCQLLRQLKEDGHRLFPALFKFTQTVVSADQRTLEGVLQWWDDHDMFLEDRWLAYFFAVPGNRKNFCTRLNHASGQGCSVHWTGGCSHLHECVMCYGKHGAFSRTHLNQWVCPAQKNVDLQLEQAGIEWHTLLSGAERLRKMRLEGPLARARNMSDLLDAAHSLLMRAAPLADSSAETADALSSEVVTAGKGSIIAGDSNMLYDSKPTLDTLTALEEQISLLAEKIKQLKSTHESSDFEVMELGRLEEFLQELTASLTLKPDPSSHDLSTSLGASMDDNERDSSEDEEPPEERLELADGCILTLKADDEHRLSAEGQVNAVYKANAQLIGSTMEVAVKMLKIGRQKRTQAAKEQIKHWEAEIEALSRAQQRCRHLVGLVSRCNSPVKYWDEHYMLLVMNYVRAGHLAQFLDQFSHSSQPLRRNLVGQVLDAYAECHAVGVYHRDVKPENVLCDMDVRGGVWLRLCDFELSKVRDIRDQTATRWVTAVASRSGDSIECFMSPEVLKVFQKRFI